MHVGIDQGKESAGLQRAAPAPLSQREERRLARQIAGLRHIDAQDRRHERSEWDKGAFCLRVKAEGLWRRAPEWADLSFLELVARIVGLRSRTTVERRMTLAERYSREEYLEYVKAEAAAGAQQREVGPEAGRLAREAAAQPSMRSHLSPSRPAGGRRATRLRSDD